MPPERKHGSISRRSALRIGAGAGATAAAAPYLARLGRGARPVDVGDAQLALSPRLSWPAPSIVTRAQWGANEAIRHPGQVYDSVVRKIVVHHTATPNSITDYPGLVRSIYSSEVAGEYIDLAYNWLIDPNGRIYEGRWATDYPAGAPHTGELNAKNVRGGHALYHNNETIGIALMGNYDGTPPSAAMINSLVTMLTWKCARWGLDPLGADPYTNDLGEVESGLPNICGHRDTIATACPGSNVEAMLPALRQRVAGKLANTGYWIASNAGQVLAFGGAPDAGDTMRLGISDPIVGIAAHPLGLGYWLLGRDGGVFTFGAAAFHGSTGGMRLNRPVVGMAPTTTGNGYFLVASDGGVFCFGDAKFHGSTGAMRLNAPVLGMAATAGGRGYWLYAADGGIFTFGDARFYGSTGALRLAAPVVGMAARPQGDGYWLVAADGGVFCFGAARFYGSAAGKFVLPTVGMAATTTGNGYVLVSRDGSIIPFGDAPNLGAGNGYLWGNAVGVAGRISPL